MDLNDRRVCQIGHFLWGMIITVANFFPGMKVNVKLICFRLSYDLSNLLNVLYVHIDSAL